MTLTVEERQLPTMYRQCWANRIEIYLAATASILGLEKISTNLALPLYQGGFLENVRQLAIVVFMIIPLVFIHLIVAQYGNQGPIGIWQCFPIGKGIGFATAILCFLQTIHVSPLVANSAYFLYASIESLVRNQKCLPWGKESGGKCVTGATMTNESMLPFKEHSPAFDYYSNVTGSQQYPKSTIKIELLDTELLTPLAIAQGCVWFLVLCFLCWGIKSLAKVFYFTIPLMFVLIITLLARAASMGDGVFEGLKETYEHEVGEWMYQKEAPKLVEDMAFFSTMWVWGRSISHLLYTLGIPFGIIFMLGSYNRYNANTIRDATLISLLAVFLPMIFGVLLALFFGHFASTLSTDETKMHLTNLVPRPGGFNGYVEHSTFTLFVRMPQVLQVTTPEPGAWTILFYLLMVVLGLHSLCIYTETLRACLQDLCPKCLKTKTLGHAIGVSLLVVILLCAGSLALATNRSNFVSETLGIVISLPLPFMMLLGALLLIFGYAISHYRSHFKNIVRSDSVRSVKCAWVFCAMFVVVGCLTIPVGLVLQTAFTYCFEAQNWVLQAHSNPDAAAKTKDELSPPISTENWESLGFAIAVEGVVVLLIFLTMVVKCVSKCRTPYVRLCHPETDWEAVAPNGISPGTEADNGFEFRNFSQASGYRSKTPTAPPTYYT